MPDTGRPATRLPPCEGMESLRLAGRLVLETHRKSAADATLSDMYVVHTCSNPSNSGVNAVCVLRLASGSMLSSYKVSIQTAKGTAKENNFSQHQTLEKKLASITQRFGLLDDAMIMFFV